MMFRAHVVPAVVRPPIVGNRGLELRRAGVSAVNQLIRRRSDFHGWLQTTLLHKHVLTGCGCGLINCR